LLIITTLAAVAAGPLQPDLAQLSTLLIQPVLNLHDVCPFVPGTPYFTDAYGSVRLDGLDTPIGAIVEAISPRGDTIGCTEISMSGHYGAMRIYGEDTSVNPPIPGMKDGEIVTFRVNGAVATAAPALVWQNDKDLHQVALTAWSPTPTPTPSLTLTPTSTPTIANMPDLMVKYMAYAPVSPTVGQAIAVTVTIKNQGADPVRISFYTSVYADHEPSGCNDLGWAYRETSNVAPGDVAILPFSHPGFAATGTHFIRAFVDSTCQIAEADETNNVNLVRVTAGSATTPTPTPTPTATPLPPVAPAVAIGRGAGSSAALTWTHTAANASYQVWRGTTPYFTPGASGSSLIGDGATGICSRNGSTITCTDPNGVGDPAANSFYLVRAFNAAAAAADSNNRVGGFAFALQPGSP
jgi:hypothetical protein